MNYLCTDKLEAYKSYRYTSNNKKKYIPSKGLSKHERRKLELHDDLKQFTVHIAHKSETCLIESVNSRIRNYLARFNRRTKRVSKSPEMLYYSLLLLFNKLYWKLEVN